MRILGVLLITVFLLGCGPSKREVELESQLKKSAQQLEKSEERLANTEENLAVVTKELADAQKEIEKTNKQNKTIVELKRQNNILQTALTKQSEDSKKSINKLKALLAKSTEKEKELEKSRKARINKIISDFNELRVNEVNQSLGIHYEYMMSLSYDVDYPISVWRKRHFTKFSERRKEFVAEARINPKNLNTFFLNPKTGSPIHLKTKTKEKVTTLRDGNEDAFAYYWNSIFLRHLTDYKANEKYWREDITKERFEEWKEVLPKRNDHDSKLKYKEIKNLSYEDFTNKRASVRKSFFTYWDNISFGIESGSFIECSEELKQPLIKLFTELAELYNE